MVSTGSPGALTLRAKVNNDIINIVGKKNRTLLRIYFNTNYLLTRIKKSGY